jgi:hypothetical protein
VRPGSREEIPTVEEAVQAVAGACDPERRSTSVATLVESFEDDDRPTTAAEDLAGELRAAARAIDPEGEDPVLEVTAATAHWLATNPGDRDRPEHAMREGTRLLYGDDAPPAVAAWLASHAG